MSPIAVLSRELEQLCIRYICSLAREDELRLYQEPSRENSGKQQTSVETAVQKLRDGDYQYCQSWLCMI